MGMRGGEKERVTKEEAGQVCLNQVVMGVACEHRSVLLGLLLSYNYVVNINIRLTWFLEI